VIWGIVALVLAALLVHWILKHDTLRWIFAVVGFLVLLGWAAKSCGAHVHTRAPASQPDRVVFGMVEEPSDPFRLPVPPLEEPSDPFRLP